LIVGLEKSAVEEIAPSSSFAWFLESARDWRLHIPLREMENHLVSSSFIGELAHYIGWKDILLHLFSYLIIRKFIQICFLQTKWTTRFPTCAEPMSSLLVQLHILLRSELSELSDGPIQRTRRTS
jgi:hypothetical protein